MKNTSDDTIFRYDHTMPDLLVVYNHLHQGYNFYNYIKSSKKWLPTSTPSSFSSQH
ncbi:unnamed protein product [Amoebophrya sp. A25]|nr:unnamed protein product [Amoebophrya sp. A25]|eukprot:GSA25T00012762001.1